MENMVRKQVVFDKDYIDDKRKSVQSTFASWLKQNLKYANESGFSIDNITVNFSVRKQYNEPCKKRIDFEQLKMLLD